MRKVDERQIGTHRYRVKQLGADTADAVLTRLFLGLGTQSLTVADIMGAKRELVASTEVGIQDPVNPGRPVTWIPLVQQYDDLLADQISERLEVLLFAWETTFGPFSDVQSTLGGFRTALLRSISPPTPAGSSTASSSPNDSKSSPAPT